MKKIVIMRAISGAGKSTVARQFGFPIVSADNYFMVDGVYCFDPRQLGDAHKHCMRQFLDLVWAGQNVVVDNTNINPEDIAPYVAVGAAMDYEVEILQIDIDPSVAAQRNVHAVPAKSVQRMFDRLQSARLPSRWTVRHVQAVVP